MTRTQRRALKRIEEIKSLCLRRAHAQKLSRRKEMTRIDAKLQPLMCEQLAYERRQDKKLSVDGWQDFPSEAYGDARQ